MARRNSLFKFESATVSIEKKKDDLFDVRYLPVEYMSDEQETDEDWPDNRFEIVIKLTYY